MSESTIEAQNDEREALISIYDGDNAFKEVDSTTFQYKYGEEGDDKTFLVELKWSENYPNEAPAINLNVFYNQHLGAEVKNKMIEILNTEAEQWLGCGMSYTLFECLKDRVEEIMALQPVAESSEESGDDDDDDDVDEETSSDESDDSEAGVSKLSLKEKKTHLTKAQKRRQWDHATVGGERPRGWDWVDIVKHLNQCGSKEQAGSIPTNYDG